MGISESHVLNAAECSMLEEVPLSVHKRWSHKAHLLADDESVSENNTDDTERHLRSYETAEFYVQDYRNDTTAKIKQCLQCLEEETNERNHLCGHTLIASPDKTDGSAEVDQPVLTMFVGKDCILKSGPPESQPNYEELKANHRKIRQRPDLLGGLFSRNQQQDRVYVDYFDRYPAQSYTPPPPPRADAVVDPKKVNALATKDQQSSSDARNQPDCNVFTVYYVPLPTPADMPSTSPHAIIHTSTPKPNEDAAPEKNSLRFVSMECAAQNEHRDHHQHHHQSTEMQFLENLYRFVLGGVSGIIGASAVFPVDVVKTRMQNQRPLPNGMLPYSGIVDCFKQIIQKEGLIGYYRGLPPLLLGVTPEKATKLAVNDFMRDQFTNLTGEISLMAEIIAGGCAGFAQVLFTNPLELIKIRMQLAGETGMQQRALAVVQEIGVRNLYNGSRACWLRDIPFTGIYFPLYAHLKAYFADSQGDNSPSSLFLAALFAGVPCAAIVTPADVIKTRLQSKPLPGHVVYTGIINASTQIYRNEGMASFWRGTLARVMRSAPQFAVTLLIYEMLQRIFYIDFGGPNGGNGTHAAVSPKHALHDHRKPIRPVDLVHRVDRAGGLCLPRFKQK